MSSPDVTYLFTNVLTLETMDYVCWYFDTEYILIEIPTGIPKDLVLKSTFNVQCPSEGVCYRQKEGGAM